MLRSWAFGYLMDKRHPFPASLFSSRFVPSYSNLEQLSLIVVQTPIAVALEVINFSTLDPAVLNPRVCGSVGRLLFCSERNHTAPPVTFGRFARLSTALGLRVSLEGDGWVSPSCGKICSNHGTLLRVRWT